MIRFLHFAFLAILVYRTESYPNGVGVDSSCSNMIPQHGITPQTSSPPFSITFNPQSFLIGQSVSVTITATGTGFKGFMMQARRADATQASVGTFQVVLNTRQACSGVSIDLN
nr:putative ferric-chelate reductase 1 [Biomphalaria glabrata]